MIIRKNIHSRSYFLKCIQKLRTPSHQCGDNSLPLHTWKMICYSSKPWTATLNSPRIDKIHCQKLLLRSLNTILMKITKPFWLSQFFMRMQLFLVCMPWINQKLCTDVLFLNQGASKPLKILQKTKRQWIFYGSFAHFDREFELN